MHLGPSALKMRLQFLNAHGFRLRITDAGVPLQKRVLGFLKDDGLVLCSPERCEAGYREQPFTIGFCSNDPEVLSLILVVQGKEECLASAEGHRLCHQAKGGPLFVNQGFDLGCFVLG